MENRKGFIAGACEDATIYHYVKNNEYRIEIEQNNKEWLQIIQNCFEKCYNKKSKIRMTSKGYYRLLCHSKSIYIELKNLRQNFSQLLDKPIEYQICFLQGVFDAEGSVHSYRNQIRVASKNKNLIDTITQMLSNLNIKFGNLDTNKTTNVISIPLYGFENIEKFSEIIGFRHPEKLKRLNKILQKT